MANIQHRCIKSLKHHPNKHHIKMQGCNPEPTPSKNQNHQDKDIRKGNYSKPTLTCSPKRFSFCGSISYILCLLLSVNGAVSDQLQFITYCVVIVIIHTLYTNLTTTSQLGGHSFSSRITPCWARFSPRYFGWFVFLILQQSVD